VSDEFLDPVFRKYFEELGIPNLMRKNSYHLLAEYVPTEKIDMEIGEKLDMIAAVAAKSRPRT
jgi:hypothetical protein